MFSLTRGTFGLTLKPKLMQIMFKPEENHFDTCLLDSDEDGETDGGVCKSSDRATGPESPLYEKPVCLNPDLSYDESD